MNRKHNYFIACRRRGIEIHAQSADEAVQKFRELYDSPEGDDIGIYRSEADYRSGRGALVVDRAESRC